MKKKTLVPLFRGLTLTLAAVLTIAVGVSVGAFLNEGDINENLNTTSRKFISDEENSVYKSDYSNWKEMVDAKMDNIKDTMGEGIVLLKNDGVLPLDSSKVTKMNIFGRNSQDPLYGGAAGCGVVDDANCEDVKTAFNNAGISINDDLYSYYATRDQRTAGGLTGTGTYTVAETNPSRFSSTLKATFNDYGDTAIIWLARNLGEGTDPEAGFMELDSAEQALINFVETDDTCSNIKNIVVVLNADNAIGFNGYDLQKDEKINAILHVGAMGINGTEALVDVLYGNTNPSGHLVDTYATSSLSSAAAQNMYDHTYDNASEINSTIGSGESATKFVAEKEGIYVGYKYYETRYEDCVLGQGSASTATAGTYETADGTGTWKYSNEMTYPFGYGLSYTKFTQTLNSVDVDPTDGTITASVTVKNTGNVAGKDVIELYAQAPYTSYDKTNLVEKASVQLMGFTKTDLLAAGEEQTYEVTSSMEFLASYDYTNAKTYILDNGNYYFAIGTDAHDALNNILAQKASDNHTTYSLEDQEGNSVTGDAAKVSGMTLEEIEGSTASIDTDGVDRTTWSKSVDTGVEITNLFDMADYNYFYNEQQYTYLTRQNWGTFPTTEDDLNATSDMIKLMSGREEIVGDLYDFSGGDYDDVTSVTTEANNGKDITYLYGEENYNSELWEEVLSNMSWTEMTNLTEANSLTVAVPSINYEGSVDGDGPAGFAGTYEGDSENPNSTGLTARIFQSQCTLASTWNTDLAYAEGSFMGEDGLWLGKIAIWAPGDNIHRTPYSARNFEYYSEDSMIAFWMGANQSAGIQDKGGISCPKHFCFNDQEKNRCSVCMFFNEQEAREIQLRAFKGTFTVGGAMATMTSYNRVGCIQDAECHELLTDVLRDEWGFKGYTISDYASQDFFHGVEDVKAGTDCMDANPGSGKYTADMMTACNNGDVVFQAAMREANKRMMYAYMNSHLVDGYYISVMPWWQSAIIAADVVIGVITLGLATAYIVFYVLDYKDKKGSSGPDGSAKTAGTAAEGGTV